MPLYIVRKNIHSKAGWVEPNLFDYINLLTTDTVYLQIVLIG
jgi:hypothetical protein